MKVGVITEGAAESVALWEMLKRNPVDGLTVVRPVQVGVHPHDSPYVIARHASGKVDMLQGLGVKRVIVLLDRESNPACPGDLSSNLQQAFHGLGYPNVRVVIKDRCYENWLIADLAALRQMRLHFGVTRAAQRRIEPDKADNVLDALAELRNMYLPRIAYHKSKMAKQIATRQNVTRMALHSRSFRRFLRVLGHPAYRTQSKRPSPPK